MPDFGSGLAPCIQMAGRSWTAVHRPHMPLSTRTAARMQHSYVKMMFCAGKVLRVTPWSSKSLNQALERGTLCTMSFGDCTWPVRALDRPVPDPWSTVPALKRHCTRLCQTCTRLYPPRLPVCAFLGTAVHFPYLTCACG